MLDFDSILDDASKLHRVSSNRQCSRYQQANAIAHIPAFLKSLQLSANQKNQLGNIEHLFIEPLANTGIELFLPFHPFLCSMIFHVNSCFLLMARSFAS